MSDPKQSNTDEEHARTLTDADVKAISETVLNEWESRFYHNIGKGLWGVVSKVLIGLMIALAAYGVATGGKFTWPSGTP